MMTNFLNSIQGIITLLGGFAVIFTGAVYWMSNLTSQRIIHQWDKSKAIELEDQKRKYESKSKQTSELKSLFSRFYAIGHYLNSNFTQIEKMYRDDEYAFADDANDYAIHEYHKSISGYVNDFINLDYTIRFTLNDTPEQIEIEKVLGEYTILVQGDPNFEKSNSDKVNEVYGCLFKLVKQVVK